jgi:hypothetical protein
VVACLASTIAPSNGSPELLEFSDVFHGLITTIYSSIFFQQSSPLEVIGYFIFLSA